MTKSTKPPRNLVRRVAMHAIPGYTLYKAMDSFRSVTVQGLRTMADHRRKLSHQRRNPAVVTYREALAKRSESSLPLEVIARSCLRHKRFFLAMGAIALSFSGGSLLGQNYFGGTIGVMFTGLCFLFVLKYEHRIWQMEEGEKHPDKPLGSFRKFFSSKGCVVRLFDPRAF